MGLIPIINNSNLRPYSYTKFLRSVGFRRIGHTPYFAFAAEPSHPSHRLHASDDPSPPFPRGRATIARKIAEFEADME
jgi:hypothetical protein